MGDVTFAVHQPNYLPWLGYFHKLLQVDVFVFLDTVQFARRGYTHRVHVAGPSREPVWLTQAIRKRAVEEQVIQDTVFADRFWVEKHLKTFEAFYGKAPHFNDVFDVLRDGLRGEDEHLARFNGRLIESIASRIGIDTRIVYASSLPAMPAGTPSERIANIGVHLNARRYFSGAGARAYNDESLFARHGIELVYSDFKPAPYRQHHARSTEDFIAGLSVVDALFNLGFDGVADMLGGEPRSRAGRTYSARNIRPPGESTALLPSF